MTTGTLLVGVYTDDKTLSIEEDFPLRVEDVSKKCALQLQIDVSFIQLFGLFHIERRIWLSPNHLLTLDNCKNKVEYVFRIRFHPEIPIKNNNFIHYFHLQYRHCFTKEFQLDNIKTSVLFGLGIFDMLTDSYKKGLTKKSDVFQSQKYKSFFPDEKLNEYNIFLQWFLKANLKKRLQKKHNEINGSYTPNQMGNLYINKMKNEFHSKINKEIYRYKDRAENERIVTIEEKDSEFVLCFEKDIYYLKNVKLVKIKNELVEIFFSGSSSKMLKMEAAISESFVSAIDGLYRLVYNYHYGICDDVLSPRIKMLQQLGCYDYIKEEIATNILTKTDRKGCFLFRMSLNDTETFDVFALGAENLKLVKFTVGPNEEFETIESLKETHTFLQHKLKPEHFEWCDLSFFHKVDNPLESSNAQLEKHNQLFLASEISYEEKPYLQGTFTETYRAKIKDCKTQVSIKTLTTFEGSYKYTQVFMEGVCSMLEMCKSSCFLQVKGFIMEPQFGLVTEYFPQRVVSYLLNNKLPLKYILAMALTVAEGLVFLRKQGIVHGDISCENLAQINVNTVRITDASIVSKVYLLPKNNVIYKSRLPWLSPELQKHHSRPTFESDIFSYGTTLCEMLCLQCMPPNQDRSQDSYEAPCRLLFNISEDEEKARSANSVTKQLHELILKCRSKKMEDRPLPHDILTELVELVHEPINEESLCTDSPTNSLCNHAWNPPILVKDIPGSMKVIQDNSRKLEVPKSAPDYEISESDLRKVKKIGSGAYGNVYLATYTTPYNERQVALKTCFRGGETAIRREFEILYKLKYERIVELVGFCPNVGIVMEFVEGGDLHSKLEKSPNALIPNLKNILLEITDGMEYLQKRKIIHCDLAARNILLTKNDHVKVTDFGLSAAIVGEEYQLRSKRYFPFHWCAPEQKTTISSKSDVWSFGVVMWECYSCGAQPILIKITKGVDLNALFALLASGKRLARPDLCSESIYKIMLHCWELKPSNRPDFSDLHRTFLNDA